MNWSHGGENLQPTLPALNLLKPTAAEAVEQPAGRYLPIGQWTGRLILPTPAQRQPDGGVFLEVQNAAPGYGDLVGQIVRLRWSSEPEVQTWVQAVSSDLTFTRLTWLSRKRGNLHPDRLNGWSAVGPLESLAGARAEDDVIVLLRDPVVTQEATGTLALVIRSEPVQITGRVFGLVTIVEREATSDEFWVRHFNPTSHQFDGAVEKLRIPQAAPDRSGVARSTNRDIEGSPLNAEGWYIYGDWGSDGLFVVQAIEPRKLMQLQVDAQYLGTKAATDYIYRGNWQDTAAQKGTAKTVLVSERPLSCDRQSLWRVGDRSLVVHMFGGIGGEKAEPAPLGLVTGHFAYGIAEVVRDPLSHELRFDIEYKQVYGHNPDGIIAGSIKWFSYNGDLQRGWLGNRPISDVLIKLDAVSQEFDFDGVRICAIDQFSRQLEAMAARYRIGHGTGAALINLATSCAQDSNQALYITIGKIRQQIRVTPQIQTWLRSHPGHPQALRFRQLSSLGRVLYRNLVPFWIARPDWHQNVGKWFRTRSIHNFLDVLLRALLTWRTMLPRTAHDEIVHAFLKQGAVLWFIRTNQVGGHDPEIQPRAPKGLLGRVEC